ncbi:CHAP domain-containing protein [Lentzea sp. CA-135723]|uniref:CHAP domain-containing protein n=1 Tax=Lentzea sp. CA-135723 TaxID=3239950 RepID=UPI003D8E478E
MTRHIVFAAALGAAVALGVPAAAIAAPAPVSAVTHVQADRAVGATTDHNLGLDGQCTWGAYEKFHEATQRWPLFSGNAADWSASARNNGWTVVLDAEVRSIVVFAPGVQGADPTYGHVAWVDNVEMRPDGTRWISITEMNGAAGPGKWSNRTIQDVVGMSYILAP